MQSVAETSVDFVGDAMAETGFSLGGGFAMLDEHVTELEEFDFSPPLGPIFDVIGGAAILSAVEP